MSKRKVGVRRCARCARCGLVVLHPRRSQSLHKKCRRLNDKEHNARWKRDNYKRLAAKVVRVPGPILASDILHSTSPDRTWRLIDAVLSGRGMVGV